MRKLLISTLCTATLFVAACSDTGKIPGVYRPDIQQGNVVTQEMVDKLRPDMTKAQVRYIMGTPLLVDTFHQDRWDYLYSLEAEGNDRTQERLSIFFEDDRLARIEGDYRPSPHGDSLSRGQESVYTVPDYDEQNQGFFSRTMENIGFGDKEESAAAETAPDTESQIDTEPADQDQEPAPEPAAAEEESDEPGFFGRMWNKIGFGDDEEDAASAAAASAPAAAAAPEPDPSEATTAPLRDSSLEEGADESQPAEAAPADEAPSSDTGTEYESGPETSEGAPVDELSEGTETAPAEKEEKGFFGRMWDKVGFGSDEE
jgi:outer membrane protein assembly factor BamE